jgi:hypothetical protein
MPRLCAFLLLAGLAAAAARPRAPRGARYVFPATGTLH